MSHDSLAITVMVTPDTDFAVEDESVRFDHLTLDFGDWRGDAAIVASTGALIEALDRIRGAARERMRKGSRLGVLPDGLDAASLAEALHGWAPGEITEVFGR